MKASIHWLKEFIDISISPQEVAHALTMAGLEVEGIETLPDDALIEVNVTPNRGDCLSILGIARELSAILCVPLKLSRPRFQYTPFIDGFSIEIVASDLCSRYVGAIIQGVKVQPTPTWMANRLIAHGFRSINSIVDITNYVMIERGQPLHAFDMDKLDRAKIRVDRVGGLREFTTLDNVKRNLPDNALLIWDGSKPVAIAGLMGGMESEVTEKTQNILIECACFDPASVRKTSKALNLKTESSYRFERGVDFDGLIPAIDRAIELVYQLNPECKIFEKNDVCPNVRQEKTSALSFEHVRKHIGASIDDIKIVSILNQLGFKTSVQEQGLLATPPSFRNDIEEPSDLIEEIARLYGYHQIPATLPKTSMSLKRENLQTKLIRRLKTSMQKFGFSEAINFSFMAPSWLDLLKLSENDVRRQVVAIQNPIKSDEPCMRTTLLPALLVNLKRNLNRGVRELKLFEIAKVYQPTDKPLPNEIVHCAAVYLIDEKPSLYKQRHHQFYDMKGIVEDWFYDLKLQDYRFDDNTLENYHIHGFCAEIIVKGVRVGAFGALRPEIIQQLDITGKALILELNLDAIVPLVDDRIQFKRFSNAPFAERDIAVIVAENVKAADVQATIQNCQTDLIESIALFDLYRGKPIETGKKSLAFSVRFKAQDRTLTDEEIDQIHQSIVNRLKQEFNAVLRDF
jgi:phenylalanyl-tRNA synthetase beta chain